jgi:hypothetical protein
MLEARRVEAEWLDELPPSDPRAQRSRRDLARVNALMANARIVANELRRTAGGIPRSIAEIGAGDGALALHVARRLSPAGPARITLLDRAAPDGEGALRRFAGLGWTARFVEADVIEWLAGTAPAGFDAIFANLFLHHFESPELAEILRLVAGRAALFVACEPRRSVTASAGSRLLGLVGCNDVTRHDAVVSVRAGFRDGELSALWPDRDRWMLEERAAGLFSHVFTARRR